ncbi:MAG: helix-turn-helix transcriptional regulator [Acidobacteria bacterium]|nr:helix-turn-helix transcriptional regulator [Acidobacteriota bacterium]
MEGLKFFRLLRGKSQFQLSLEAKIPSYRLSRLENGKVQPTPDELERLATALGTTTEVLRREITEEALVATGAT